MGNMTRLEQLCALHSGPPCAATQASLHRHLQNNALTGTLASSLSSLTSLVGLYVHRSHHLPHSTLRLSALPAQLPFKQQPLRPKPHPIQQLHTKRRRPACLPKPTAQPAAAAIPPRPPPQPAAARSASEPAAAQPAAAEPAAAEYNPATTAQPTSEPASAEPTASEPAAEPATSGAASSEPAAKPSAEPAA
jgi:hypothetical protein